MPLMAALLALAILVALGNNWLQSTTIEVESARLPASFDGYCIVQVSDLHGHRFGRNQSRLVKAVREAHPDLIAVTGDLTSWGRWNAEDVEGLARQLRDIAPVYFITGNHDHYARDLPKLLSLLEAVGVKVLAGTSMDIARGSQSITIAGIQDPPVFPSQRGRIRGDHPMEIRVGGPSSHHRAAEILAAAVASPRVPRGLRTPGLRPRALRSCPRRSCRLPVVGALYTPDQGSFPPLTSGVHRRGETALVVSRGLGNSKFPFRVLNRPELVVVRLKRTSG